MNSGNDNTLVKGRPKTKGFKGIFKSNKKDCKMFKQVGIKDKWGNRETFSFKKKLFSDHHESTNFPIVFDIQGANVSFFNSFIQILFPLPSFRNYIEQSSHVSQIASLANGLVEDIKRWSTSVITSA